MKNRLLNFLIWFGRFDKGFERQFNTLVQQEDGSYLIAWEKQTTLARQLTRQELSLLRGGFYLSLILQITLMGHMLIVLVFTPFFEQIYEASSAIISNWGFIIAVPVVLYWTYLLLTAGALPSLFIKLTLEHLGDEVEQGTQNFQYKPVPD